MNGANLVIYPSFISLLLFYIYIHFFSHFLSLSLSLSVFLFSIYISFLVVLLENDRVQMYRKLRMSSFSGGWIAICVSKHKLRIPFHFGCLHSTFGWIRRSISVRNNWHLVPSTSHAAINSAPTLWSVSLWIFLFFQQRYCVSTVTIARKLECSPSHGLIFIILISVFIRSLSSQMETENKPEWVRKH